MASADPRMFDFIVIVIVIVIVIGAGSAGCVLADRLTADSRNTVLVLEFGGSDRSRLIRMPAALSIPMNTAKYDWRYETEPEPHLGGRRLHCPRGKVIGGSSSINDLVYARGNPLDFERWEEEGAAGWGYRYVLPYFRRAEARQEGGDAWRGASGPLATRYGRLANPLYRAFVEAAGQAGYPATHLLKLSGVGPAGELKPLGIDVVHHLPGVGENLQDHSDPGRARPLEQDAGDRRPCGQGSQRRRHLHPRLGRTARPQRGLG